MNKVNVQNAIIGVIGLGYVGLPLAVSFAKKFSVSGFDIKKDRINELKKGFDRNLEVNSKELLLKNIQYTNHINDLKKANFFIVTIPTPVNKANNPDLTFLYKASESVATILKPGDYVVYESTVYPGTTEEECIPILEKKSGLKTPTDFKVGYSPERINPGDTKHRFETITKVVSGIDEESLNTITQIYESVVTAGVYKASSIKVAEAGKIIENTQRDLNIALMNELSLICEKLDIDTLEVIETASTKWNFLKFFPGLVGGHCIGVDPYYLTYKAQMLGYIPEVILAGRKINDQVGKYVAQRTLREIIKSRKNLEEIIITILGITFKENCPDIRNSKVIDIINELHQLGIKTQIYDPYAYQDEVKHEYNLELQKWEDLKPANAIIIAVAHKDFITLSEEHVCNLIKNYGTIADLKGILNRNNYKSKNINLWRL